MTAVARSRSTRRRLRRRHPTESRSQGARPSRSPVPQRPSARWPPRTGRSSRSIRRRRPHRSQSATIDTVRDRRRTGSDRGADRDQLSGDDLMRGGRRGWAGDRVRAGEPRHADAGADRRRLAAARRQLSEHASMHGDGTVHRVDVQPAQRQGPHPRDDRDRSFLPGQRRGVRHRDPVPGDHHRAPGHVRSRSSSSGPRCISSRPSPTRRSAGSPARPRPSVSRSTPTAPGSVTTPRPRNSSSAGSRSRRARR